MKKKRMNDNVGNADGWDVLFHVKNIRTVIAIFEWESIIMDKLFSS